MKFKHKPNPKDLCECGHQRVSHIESGCIGFTYNSNEEMACNCLGFTLKLAFMQGDRNG